MFVYSLMSRLINKQEVLEIYTELFCSELQHFFLVLFHLFSSERSIFVLEFLQLCVPPPRISLNP